MKQKFLVTGGAGYVGSHMVDLLVKRGDEVTVIDDLRQGHRDSLPDTVAFYNRNINDIEFLNSLFSKIKFDAIFHFAAMSLVGDSMQDPLKYLVENASGGFNLIHAAIKHEIPKFILSSTANIYGDPEYQPISELSARQPSSPYGESKLMLEKALQWAEICHGLRFGILRYFNAAGSDPDGRLGEDHNPESHLIPLVIDAVLGRRKEITIFGNDYNTPDGTCIRDYVHVVDLARAHLVALNQLDNTSVIYNVGTGVGHSVLEIIKAVEGVSGLQVPFTIGTRRDGDPARLIASPHSIMKAGWEPSYKLKDTVSHAFNWRKLHPNGYRT